MTHSGSMVVNPDTPEAYQLKGWYDNQGMNENFKSLKVEAGPNQNYIKNRQSAISRRTTFLIQRAVILYQETLKLLVNKKTHVTGKSSSKVMDGDVRNVILLSQNPCTDIS